MMDEKVKNMAVERKDWRHTDRIVVALAGFIGGLVLVLMVATAVFFMVVVGWMEEGNRALRVCGAVAWMYGWVYLYYKWTRWATTWWKVLGGEN